MASYNQWTGIGNTTRDVQIKNLPGDSIVAEFGFACNRKYKTRDGQDKEEPLFLDCSAFGKQAEILNQYATKGKQMLLAGRLVTHQWEDKQSGAKRSKISLVVNEFQFLGSKDDAGDERPQRQQSARPAQGGARRPTQAHQEAPYGDEKQFDEADIPFAREIHRTPI